MTEKKQHGGARKGAGRKRSLFPKQTLVINCTDEEKRRIMDSVFDPRKRAEVLLQEADRVDKVLAELVKRGMKVVERLIDEARNVT